MLGVGLMLLSAVAAAEPVRAPTAAITTTTAIRAGRFLDPKTGAMRTDEIVLIEGERITAVGPKLTIPTGATVIDLSGATVMPGLIDCHSHLLEADSGSISEDDNHILTVAKMTTATRALLGAYNAKGMLEAGFTTVRDLGNSGLNGDVALRDAISAGWVVGPRIVAATRALSATGGQFGRINPVAKALISQEYAVVDGVVEARRAVRQALYDGADVIKVIVDTEPRVLSVEEVTAIVDEAHRAKRKVAAHAVSEEAMCIAATAGVDSIEHGYYATESALRLMAKKNVVLVPTDLLYETADEIFVAPRNPPAELRAKIDAEIRSGIELRKKRLALAVKLGVKIAAGSDIYFATPGRTRGFWSVALLKALHAEGMSNLDAIRSATTWAATLLGWQDRVGALEAGHFADIIAVKGDPLADLAVLDQMTFVMKGGVVIANDVRPLPTTPN